MQADVEQSCDNKSVFMVSLVHSLAYESPAVGVLQTDKLRCPLLRTESYGT